MVRAEHDHTAGPALNVVDPVGVKLLWLERLAMELQLVPGRGGVASERYAEWETTFCLSGWLAK